MAANSETSFWGGFAWHLVRASLAVVMIAGVIDYFYPVLPQDLQAKVVGIRGAAWKQLVQTYDQVHRE